jgi:tRNA G37 N-methylase Trm5
MASRLRNKHILELGAGCAVPSLAAMMHSTPASITVSDLNPDTMENIQYNIGLNPSECQVTACTIDWNDDTTYPECKMDYVICSDCIYQKDVVPLLKRVIMGTLKEPSPGAQYSESDIESNVPSFLYVAPEGGRDGLPEFISTMKSNGFQCVKEEIAPELYQENPLKSQDEEDCFLHFHELASTAYVLYEFQRC